MNGWNGKLVKQVNQMFQPSHYNPSQHDPSHYQPSHYDPSQYDPSQYDPLHCSPVAPSPFPTPRTAPTTLVRPTTLILNRTTFEMLTNLRANSYIIIYTTLPSWLQDLIVYANYLYPRVGKGPRISCLVPTQEDPI